MSPTVGIGLAFVAMLCWGFGDFWIQKSTRKVGDWETLFVITLFGSVILLPFVYRNLPTLFLNSYNDLLILVACSVVLFCAAILDLEALKEGKLAVIEPIWSFEIPAAAFLAFFILRDRVSWLQISLIIFLITGLCLLSFREKYLSKRFFLEKGILIAFISALLMGASDFLLGWGSRVTDPLTANFVVNVFMAATSGVYITARGKVGQTIKDVFANRALLLNMSISDNVAWVAYAFAMTIVPIAVATGLSESSVVVGVILGLLVNREKLQVHQKVGLVVAVVAALVLAATTAAL